MPPNNKKKPRGANGALTTTENNNVAMLAQSPQQVQMSRQNSSISQNSDIILNDLALKITSNSMVNSQNVHKEQINVILRNHNTDQIKHIPNQEIQLNEGNAIILGPLVQKLEILGFQLNNCLISQWNSARNIFILCGKAQLEDDVTIPYSAIDNGELIIKVRHPKKQIVELLVDEMDLKEDDDHSDTKSNAGKNRVKERKIGEVVEKVALWRRFYTGFYDDKGEFIHMPLDQAAMKVGISKKTLDDYLLQIRCGKKYGFDFNNNLKERIGVLRSFVKQHKQTNVVGHDDKDISEKMDTEQ